MYQQYREGWIEVICGCMFAGKSEELIRRIHVLSYAKKEIQIFKPQIDDRYAKNEVVAHNGARIPCTAVKDSKELASKIAKTTEVVAVDEVQFFDEGMIGLCEQLASQGRRVMLAGSGLPRRTIWHHAAADCQSGVRYEIDRRMQLLWCSCYAYTIID